MNIDIENEEMFYIRSLPLNKVKHLSRGAIILYGLIEREFHHHPEKVIADVIQLDSVELQKKLDYGPEWVRRALERLEELGIIERIKHPNKTYVRIIRQYQYLQEENRS